VLRRAETFEDLIALDGDAWEPGASEEARLESEREIAQ
jgi:hypothetical protein